MNFLEENKTFWKKFADEDRMCTININTFEELTKDLFKNFKDKKVLDFGCGTGRVYPLFKEVGVEYYGIDISPEVLELFKSKFPEANFQLNGEFQDETFDIIWIWSIFTHYPIEDIEEMLKEMKRILKKEGKIYFSYIPSNNAEEDFKDVGFFTHRKENIENLLNKLNLKFEKLDIIFPKEGQSLRQILMECTK